MPKDLLIFLVWWLILDAMLWMTRAEPSAKKRRTQARTTSLYGRLLLCAYALFLAAIAPFICWGTVGDPAHGHSGSHFIFDEEISAVSAHSSKTHGHEYCSHDPMLRHNRLDPNRAAAATIPGVVDEEGERSAPIITLISMIMLLLFGARETLFKSARQIITLTFSIPVKDVFLLVPIPPPRVSAFSLA